MSLSFQRPTGGGRLEQRRATYRKQAGEATVGKMPKIQIEVTGNSDLW
jgi:hypothetical protein